MCHAITMKREVAGKIASGLAHLLLADRAGSARPQQLVDLVLANERRDRRNEPQPQIVEFTVYQSTGIAAGHAKRDRGKIAPFGLAHPVGRLAPVIVEPFACLAGADRERAMLELLDDPIDHLEDLELLEHRR